MAFVWQPAYAFFNVPNSTVLVLGWRSTLGCGCRCATVLLGKFRNVWHSNPTDPTVICWCFNTIFSYIFSPVVDLLCRSQLPRGLRRRSSATRLLRLWVRIPPGAWMLSVVSVAFCQVEVPATDWSPVQGSPTDSGALLCVIKKPRKRGG